MEFVPETKAGTTAAGLPATLLPVRSACRQKSPPGWIEQHRRGHAAPMRRLAVAETRAAPPATSVCAAWGDVGDLEADVSAPPAGVFRRRSWRPARRVAEAASLQFREPGGGEERHDNRHLLSTIARAMDFGAEQIARKSHGRREVGDAFRWRRWLRPTDHQVTGPTVDEDASEESRSVGMHHPSHARPANAMRGHDPHGSGAWLAGAGGQGDGSADLVGDQEWCADSGRA